MSSVKPVRGTRTFEGVVNQVREMLTGGALNPGERLPPEREFARQLKVSRSALREGLRTLEIAGIVELRKGRAGGAFITRGNPRVVSDSMADLLRLGDISWSHLTEARIWIEEVIVRVACNRATRQDIEALEENIRQASLLFEKGQLMAKTDVLIEFHNILAQATRNPVLVMITRMLTDMLRYFTRRLGSETTRAVFRSRRRFMAAFTQGDAEAAVKEMERNLRKVHRLYLRLAQSGQINPRAARST
jgi:GntR family transcriptional regulator, transcriptional repressor for pyruvate dehydrogenase complex